MPVQSQRAPLKFFSHQDSEKISTPDERQIGSSTTFIMHCVNSIQIKFEKLKFLNDFLQANVLVVSETKIDALYPNTQFKLQRYQMYRKDRKKDGGELIAYFSSSVPSKKIPLAKAYKSLEAIVEETKIRRNYISFLTIERPPEQCKRRDRETKSKRGEGKILKDLEEVKGQMHESYNTFSNIFGCNT